MAEDTIEDAIERNAKGPKKVTGDSGSTEQHPLPDQIAADKYVRSKQATSSSGTGLGLRYTKLIPPNSD